MPVDLSIPNSIIGAYAQGRQEALQRLKNVQEQQQQAIENEQKQKAADEQRRQFEASLKQAHELESQKIALDKAHLDISKTIALAGFQHQAEETGVAPPGFMGSAPQGTPGYAQPLPQLDPSTGQPMSQTFYGVPGSIFGGQNFQARTQAQATADEISKLKAVTGVKTEGDIVVHRAEQAERFFYEREIKQLEAQNRLQEDYFKPTENVFADRVSRGIAAQKAIDSGNTDPSLFQAVKDGQMANDALDRIAKLKEAERPANTALEIKKMQGEDIANEIIAGRQPPDLSRLYGVSAFVRDSLAQQKYDLTGATKDWQATTGWIHTLNNPQQVRVRQAAAQLSDAIPVLENLYNVAKEKIGNSNLKVFNAINLERAVQLGGDVGAAAQALRTQIADMTPNLAALYAVGNAPTDKNLQLASQNLSGNWDEPTFKKALDLLHTNLNIRINSILNTGPAGASQGNIYAPPGTSPLGDASKNSNPNIIQFDNQGNRITPKGK